MWQQAMLVPGMLQQCVEAFERIVVGPSPGLLLRGRYGYEVPTSWLNVMCTAFPQGYLGEEPPGPNRALPTIQSLLAIENWPALGWMLASNKLRNFHGFVYLINLDELVFEIYKQSEVGDPAPPRYPLSTLTLEVMADLHAPIDRQLLHPLFFVHELDEEELTALWLQSTHP
jgi:hypothetical protein